MKARLLNILYWILIFFLVFSIGFTIGYIGGIFEIGQIFNYKI